MKTFDEFINEQKFSELDADVNEGIGSKILTGAALIASLIGGPKSVRAGGFKDIMNGTSVSLATSVTPQYSVTVKMSVSKQQNVNGTRAKLVVNANDVAINYGHFSVMFKDNAVGQFKTIDLNSYLSCPEINTKHVDTSNGVVFKKSTEEESMFKFKRAEEMLAKIKLANPTVDDAENIVFDVVAAN